MKGKWPKGKKWAAEEQLHQRSENEENSCQLHLSRFFRVLGVFLAGFSFGFPKLIYFNQYAEFVSIWTDSTLNELRQLTEYDAGGERVKPRTNEFIANFSYFSLWNRGQKVIKNEQGKAGTDV